MDIDAARIGLATPGVSPKIDSLKQSKFLLLLDLANIKADIKALQPAPNPPAVDLHAVERKRLQDALTTCNAEIASVEEQISNSEKIVSNQKSCLLLPTFGAENEVCNQKLRLQVPLFDPMLNNPTIDDFWKKLIDYGEGLHWSEEGYKKALSNLLQQEAYKLYYIMRKKSLKDILAALQGSYYDYETVLDVQKKLDAATRRPDQSITNFMNNVHSLLYQTSAMRLGICSETESKAVEQEILRQKLMTNVSANAKEHLHKCIKKGMKRGEVFSYEMLLSLAKEAEHEEGLPINHSN